MTTSNKGAEHYYFFRLLSIGIPQGVENVAQDTPERADWLRNHPHWPPSVFLIAGLSYVEGVLGRDWLDRYGGNERKQLCGLVICRNALVHCGGRLDALTRKQRTHSGVIDPKKHATACHQYVDGIGRDLRRAFDENKEKRPARRQTVPDPYFTVERDSTVRLNEHAFHWVSALLLHVLADAGEIR